MLSKKFKIGSDPEYFLQKNGRPISAVGLIPGTKKNPYRIGEHESVQLDNVALEFNVKPSDSPEEFIESLGVCHQWAYNHLNSIDPEIQLLAQASAEFDESELDTIQAKMFGCEPDLNAWEHGSVNCAPDSSGNLRSCGGHIHIGLEAEGDEPVDTLRFIRLMDKNVGIYTNSVCGDQRRRELYGKAGAFREKSYGVEYRTPSVSWLKTEESIREVFSLVEKTIEEYNAGEDAELYVKYVVEEGEEVTWNN